MSGDACKVLARRDVLLLRADGEVLEVVVFSLLIPVDNWGDPATGVSSVRVSLVHSVPSSHGVPGARGVCTSSTPCGCLAVNLGSRSKVVSAGAVDGAEHRRGDLRDETPTPVASGSTQTHGGVPPLVFCL